MDSILAVISLSTISLCLISLRKLRCELIKIKNHHFKVMRKVHTFLSKARKNGYFWYSTGGVEYKAGECMFTCHISDAESQELLDLTEEYK